MMNERIEQLLEQARAECFRFGSKPATTVGYDELEKFAELIVKECVRYFNEDYVRDFDVLWREDLSKGMKEHFGVEE
jgi:hypothetical protein